VATELVTLGLRPEDVDSADRATIIKAEEVCSECYLSCVLLRGADNSRYFQLKVDLSNDMTKGTDNYPKTIVETMRLLTDCIPHQYCSACAIWMARDWPSSRVRVARRAVRRVRAKSNAGIVVGHTSRASDHSFKLLDTGVQNLIIDDCSENTVCYRPTMATGLFRSRQKECEASFHPTTRTSTHYPEILSNLKKQACGLIGHINAGSCGMDSSGSLGALEQVWLNKGGVATIIPLKKLEKLCPMVYDSTRNRGAFVCRTKDGDVVLKNNGKGMPYFDLREFEAEADLSFAPEAALSFVQTVRGNMEGFTKREVEEAQKARKAQAMLGHPTDRDFLGMVRGGMISNCLVTANAVNNAHQIFGPDLVEIRGRTSLSTEYHS
jgi:hypothetical protein